MNSGDTIVAISSAIGTGSRLIVRASGPGVHGLVEGVVSGKIDFVGGSAIQARLSIAGMPVPAWVYCLQSPASATGEDIVEFHIPGNPLLARMLLDSLVRAGARHAQPGEFTARAFFNGKLNLTEAEGVAAIISATNERELLAARQLMAGELAHRLRPVMDSVADTLALIEAGIDFSDQDISFLTIDQIRRRIIDASNVLTSLLQESSRFERLSHEPQVVLIGRPNAGKSTLLNALAGHQRAIVSPIAGTTRDILWADVHLARGIIRLIDVAGLEDRPGEQLIDQSMQQQARRAIEEADLIVSVRDCTDSSPPMQVGREATLRVLTKIDLLDRSSMAMAQPGSMRISALTGAGMPELRQELDDRAFGQSGSATLALNARHVSLINQAHDSLTRAGKLLPDGGLELLAIELREGLDALGEILGSITPDNVLGRVFSRFCIGK